MLAYTIEAAIGSGIFDAVYVSTEDSDIARIAESAGAVAHPRPEELAGDLVSATDVCIELQQALHNHGASHDAIICLQPSSPLRDANDIRAAWEQFSASSADYLVSVTPVDPHYFHWAVHDSPQGWEMYFGDKFMLERPLLPPVFRPNGAIKIGKTGPLTKTRNFFGKPLATYEMPESRSIHVAEQFDLDVTEHLMRKSAHP